jgi:hypothetical protein
MQHRQAQQREMERYHRPVQEQGLLFWALVLVMSMMLLRARTMISAATAISASRLRMVTPVA